jgi:hypothetical protein
MDTMLYSPESTRNKYKHSALSANDSVHEHDLKLRQSHVVVPRIPALLRYRHRIEIYTCRIIYGLIPWQVMTQHNLPDTTSISQI